MNLLTLRNTQIKMVMKYLFFLVLHRQEVESSIVPKIGGDVDVGI